MVWHLQDLQDHIDADQIEAPQLLPGIDMATDIEERKKNRRLYKPEMDDEPKTFEIGVDADRAFKEQNEKAKQIMFKEREVDNLMNLIYGESAGMETSADDEDTERPDTNRYDSGLDKLSMFTRPAVKRKLKSKFVTGQGSDQIVQNLLNMSDSENEDDAEKRKLDKEQLRKIEAND